MSFDEQSRKRELKIKILSENIITKARAFLSEEKSAQFYEQKTRQLDQMRHGVMDTTEQMMSESYTNVHEPQFNDAQEAHDDIIIKIEKKLHKKGNGEIVTGEFAVI